MNLLGQLWIRKSIEEWPLICLYEDFKCGFSSLKNESRGPVSFRFNWCGIVCSNSAYKCYNRKKMYFSDELNVVKLCRHNMIIYTRLLFL